ncbi:MAG: hypothetical protein M1826_007685 [Phylliscum demangeonii]|nr:MAG: hypothetical protein M1826_007685 [Phylliscum demangeonii]
MALALSALPLSPGLPPGLPDSLGVVARWRAYPTPIFSHQHPQDIEPWVHVLQAMAIRAPSAGKAPERLLSFDRADPYVAFLAQCGGLSALKQLRRFMLHLRDTTLPPGAGWTHPSTHPSPRRSPLLTPAPPLDERRQRRRHCSSGRTPGTRVLSGTAGGWWNWLAATMTTWTRSPDVSRGPGGGWPQRGAKRQNQVWRCFLVSAYPYLRHADWSATPKPGLRQGVTLRSLLAQGIGLRAMVQRFGMGFWCSTHPRLGLACAISLSTLVAHPANRRRVRKMPHATLDTGLDAMATALSGFKAFCDATFNTTEKLHFNVQVQVNRKTGEQALRRLKGRSATMTLIPVDISWSADEIRAKIMADRLPTFLTEKTKTTENMPVNCFAPQLVRSTFSYLGKHGVPAKNIAILAFHQAQYEVYQIATLRRLGAPGIPHCQNPREEGMGRKFMWGALAEAVRKCGKGLKDEYPPGTARSNHGTTVDLWIAVHQDSINLKRGVAKIQVNSQATDRSVKKRIKSGNKGSDHFGTHNVLATIAFDRDDLDIDDFAIELLKLGDAIIVRVLMITIQLDRFDRAEIMQVIARLLPNRPLSAMPQAFCFDWPIEDLPPKAETMVLRNNKRVHWLTTRQSDTVCLYFRGFQYQRVLAADMEDPDHAAESTTKQGGSKPEPDCA